MLQVLLEFWTTARAGSRHFVTTSLAAGSISGLFVFYQPRSTLSPALLGFHAHARTDRLCPPATVDTCVNDVRL